MPVGNLSGWTQVFTEDFTTPAALGSFAGIYLNNPANNWAWGSYDGGTDTSGHGLYDSSKVLSVSGSVLDYYVHTESGTHYVAAIRPWYGHGPQGGTIYGRCSVRFRSDPVYGYKIAWLLWPDSNVSPRDGEIDWPEANLDNTIFGTNHALNLTGTDINDWFDSGVSLSGGWHTAVIEWTPGSIVMILDGVVKHTYTDYIPSTEMHWVLQAETNLDGWEPTDNTAAGHLQIDWTVVYSYSP